MDSAGELYTARETIIEAFLDGEFEDGYAILYPFEEFYVIQTFQPITVH